MCGAMVGCVVCEGYVFLIKKLHIYLIIFWQSHIHTAKYFII